MRRFRLKVYRAPGDICTLTLQAADAVGATAQARAQGYHVFSAHAVGAGLLPQRRGTRFSVPLFSQELLALLQAGLSLVETIGILARKSRDASARRVLEELARHLREGLPLSRAARNWRRAERPSGRQAWAVGASSSAAASWGGPEKARISSRVRQVFTWSG